MSGAGAAHAHSVLECPACGAAIPAEAVNIGGFFECGGGSKLRRGCGRKLRVEAFPALTRPPERPPEEQSALEGEASCFYHPAKTAAAVCSGCGRFICALCEVDLGEGSLCPSCVASGKRKKNIRALEVSRKNYGKYALAFAIIPAFTIVFSLIGAPISLFICIRYWNAPRSLVRPSRAPMIVAAILSVIELVVMGLLIAGLSTGIIK